MPIPVLSRLPIRLRLALGFGLFLVVVMAVSGVFLLEAMHSDLMREADETLALRATHVERGIADGEGQLGRASVGAALSDLLPFEEFSAPGVYVQVLDHRGVSLASSPNLPGGQLPASAASVVKALDGQEIYVTVLSDGERVRELARPLKRDGRVLGVLLVGESLHLLDATLRRMRQLLAIVSAAAALACLLGGWWLVARALGPVAEATQAARFIGATGQFDRRITVPPARDELGELAVTFNEMLARLQETLQQQKEFLADVSHELRGPLTVIRGNLGLLELDLPEQERLDSIRETRIEAERMSRLVSDLLFLAWVDVHHEAERHPAQLHQLVLEVADRVRGLDAGSHEILLASNQPTTVLGDRERLGQMLWNLVENALRYTPVGGRVTLSLRNQGQFAELTVADTGIGIPPEHLPRIFERFYRIDPARPRGQGSSGLGLAIVKQVAESHGGEVRVFSEPEHGSVFTVTIPALHG